MKKDIEYELGTGSIVAARLLGGFRLASRFVQVMGVMGS